MTQPQQRYEAEFDAQIDQVLAEATQLFRTLGGGLRLQLVRPNKPFERAARTFEEKFGDIHYVVADEHCWFVAGPRLLSRSSAAS
ncbi:hypothetical protein [Nocardia testacea]|uniref:hypothetical protein n=1 Tax=Nocardia testacea TaxID=248551 RepID=UPI0034108282